MTFEAGTTIGRYQILGDLGHGGMASVYKAFQPALERVVALKVLRPAYAHDPEFLARFRREALAIARLRHPHIVQVHDFDEAAGVVFLVMEHIEGGTLKDKLKQLHAEGRGLPWSETARIVREVADGLSHAHAQGIVHRDVKPSNVMLTRDGRAVVTDFGIAKILAAAGQTETGVGVGTPEYMSPEQGQAGPIDHRSDVYSLGVLAYELLTGRVPFTADTPLAVILAHVREPLPLPSKVDPRIGPRTERVLLRALAKDPAARYQTATELAAALEGALAAESERGSTVATLVARDRRPTAAPRAAPRWRPTPPPITNRSFVVGVVGGVLVLYIAGAGLFGALRGEQQPGAGTPPAATSDPARSATGPRSETPRAAAATTATTAATTATTAATTVISQPTATLPPLTLAPAPTVVRADPTAPTTTALPPTAAPGPTATLPPPTSAPTPALTPLPSGATPTPLDPSAPRFGLTGRITSAATGAPLANVNIQLFSFQCCRVLASAQTNAQGNYQLLAPSSTYWLHIEPAAATGYVPTYWKGSVSFGTASVVTVQGAPLSGLDLALPTGFAVGGKVTSASGAPAANASLAIHDASGHITGANTDPSGIYAVRLPNGTFEVWLCALGDNSCNQQAQRATVTVNGKDQVVDLRYP